MSFARSDASLNASRRVNSSVGRLVASHRNQRFTGRVPREEELHLAGRAWLGSLVDSACHESRGLCAPRYPKLASPPNKRMHATANTMALIFINGAGRRVMRGVRRLMA
jgi:hypothetical protein